MCSFRLMRVVLGITGACIAAGAAAGILCGIPLTLVFDGPSGLLDGGLFAVAAIVGGICGLLLGPLAAFGFLRRVPLGLFAETAVGAAVGGLAGFAINIFLPVDLLVAAGGFAAAVAHLAWRYGEHRVGAGGPGPAPLR